jgi:hypothetical protein
MRALRFGLSLALFATVTLGGCGGEVALDRT